jgi:hypothetical protein
VYAVAGICVTIEPGRPATTVAVENTPSLSTFIVEKLEYTVAVVVGIVVTPHKILALDPCGMFNK